MRQADVRACRSLLRHAPSFTERHYGTEITGQGYGHLRTEQHRGAFSQLPARPPVHECHPSLDGRLWHRLERLRLHGADARFPHLRHGDRVLPLRQPAGRRPAAHLCQRTALCRRTVTALRHRLPRRSGTALRRAGVCRPPRVRGHDGRGRGARLVPVHPLRLPALQEAAHKVRRHQALLHRGQHRAQPLLLGALSVAHADGPRDGRLVL